MQKEQKRGRSRYKTTGVVFQGVRYDSEWELKRWLWLKDEEVRGRIRGLRRQVEFDYEVNGLVAWTYTADAVYRRLDSPERVTIEDAKPAPHLLEGEFKTKWRTLMCLFSGVHHFRIAYQTGLTVDLPDVHLGPRNFTVRWGGERARANKFTRV